MSSFDSSVNWKTAMRLAPYYIENGKLMVLFGLSKKWSEWTILGGGCAPNERDLSCLKREVLEESKLLLNLDMSQEALDSCFKIEYFEEIQNRKSKKQLIIFNVIYFVNCFNQRNEISKIINNFQDTTDEMLKNELFKKNLLTDNYDKVYDEMKDFKFIEIRGADFRKYMVNTLKYYQRHLEDFKDDVFTAYLKKTLGYLTDFLPETGVNLIEDSPERLDIHLLTGLVHGFTQILYKKSKREPLDIDDTIMGIDAMIRFSPSICDISLSNK